MRAREMVVINSGLIESRVCETIHARFPWVTIHSAAADVDYYAAKSLGVALTTGEASPAEKLAQRIPRQSEHA
jgi:hypothetical protein